MPGVEVTVGVAVKVRVGVGVKVGVKVSVEDGVEVGKMVPVEVGVGDSNTKVGVVVGVMLGVKVKVGLAAREMAWDAGAFSFTAVSGIVFRVISSAHIGEPTNSISDIVK